MVNSLDMSQIQFAEIRCEMFQMPYWISQARQWILPRGLHDIFWKSLTTREIFHDKMAKSMSYRWGEAERRIETSQVVMFGCKLYFTE